MKISIDVVKKESSESDSSIDSLLSLQQLEGESDEALLQLFSTSSCVYGSCLGS